MSHTQTSNAIPNTDHHQPPNPVQATPAETQALYHASRSLIAVESLPDLLQSIVDSVAEALSADQVILITFDLEAHHTVHFVKGGPGASQIVRISFDELWEGLSGWVLRELKPALSPKGIPDPRESPTVQQHRAEAHCGAIMVVPLCYRNNIFGTMTAVNRSDEPDFSQRDLNLMAAIANQAAVAVENARLYDEAQQEIAERKQIELLLKESQEWYRCIADNIQDGLTIIEHDRAIYANDRACEIFGYPKEEYVEMNGLDLAAPEEREQLKQIAREAKQTGLHPQEIEFWIIRKNGTRRCIRNRYSPISRGGATTSRLVVTTDITERKLAEEALQESEAKYRNLVEQIPAITYIAALDEYSTTLYVSPQAEAFLGYSPADYAADPDIWRKRLHPDDYERVMQELAHSHASGEPFDCKYRMLTRDNRVLWFHDEATIVHGDTDQPIFLQGIMLNITDHKLAEEALQESEGKLKQRATQLALLNDIGGKIAAVLELDSVLERAAHLVQESFAYHHVGLFDIDHERNEFVMRARAGKFAHLFDPDHRLKLGQGMVGWAGQHGERLLANDVDAEPHYVNLYPGVLPTQSELSVPIRVGTEILGVLDVQSPKYDAFDENDVMVMETLADQIAIAIENARLYQTTQRELAERVRAEEALRESEERYRAVSELTSDYAYATRVEPDGTMAVEWVTEAFTHITGFTHDELRTRDDWRQGFIHPDDLAIARQLLQNHLSGQPDATEFRIITKSGQVRWLRDYGRPIWGPDENRVVRIYGAAQDITEQKRLGQYMLRTERLAAMGHMAAALAHEIKNPLQAISSNLELALDFPLEPSEREEHLYVCRQEIERLADITQQVLSFARPSQDTLQSISIRQLVQQALALVRQPMQNNRVRATTDLPTKLPPILASPDQIVQVLLNIILNSIEAMPEGGHLYITTHFEGDTIVLDLSNDGPSIPSEHLEHIFDPFFTTKPEGTGLGLAISHSIIQGYGGTLRVENRPGGQGVSFRITLPTASSNEEQEASL